MGVAIFGEDLTIADGSQETCTENFRLTPPELCEPCSPTISPISDDPCDDPDDSELVDAQSRSTDENDDAQSAEKRARVLLPAPKILKNDIRRYYSRMFMNTINSADFGNIQNFFNTFMPWPCKFVADQDLVCEMKVPRRIITDGPRQMGHYLLGCFVQYPDMSLMMQSCEIITSPTNRRTRIKMNIEIKSTKIYDLEMSEWLPQLATLDKTYQRALEDAAAAKEAKQRSALLLTQGPVPASPSDPAAATIGGGGEVVVKRPRGRPRNSQSKDPTQANSTGTKRKKPATQNASTGAVTEIYYDAADGQSVSSRSASELTRSHIPEAFVHGLFAKAKLVPTPISLVLRGDITLYLDENNLMQHVCLNMLQVNK
jgi:hypothetical protein